MNKKSDKTFHAINPCGISRRAFDPSYKDGRKPCKKCGEEKGHWVFHFEDGSHVGLGEDNIECSCASGTVDCIHLKFLFNKVLILRELGESLYDYGDMDKASWQIVVRQLDKLFVNPCPNTTQTTCSICFEDLNGIHNISDCNHVHNECMGIAKQCHRCR